jgi:DNA polymerase III subunit beta
MLVSCTQENLAKGLGIVGRLVGGRTTLPVLNNILIKTEKGGLNLVSTDLEVGINTWIGAKVDEEGAITVPAKLLVDFVSNNTDKKIDLSLKELSLKLSSEHFKANIKGIDASEFPLIPRVKKQAEIEIDGNVFRHAISKVLIAVALDESRPVLAGVYFNAKDNTLKMVATDSYRLSEQKITLSKKTENEISLIVPARPLGEILRIMNDSINKIIIFPGENQVEFVVGETTVVSRLIDGAFPDYEQIIPSKTTTQVTVSTQEFTSAIKMAQIFARDNANNIKLDLAAPNKILIVSSSPNIGDNVSEISGEVTGEEIKIAFNAKFILDALGVLESEKIKLDLSGDMAAGQLIGEKDSNFLHLIMPLKVDE